MAPADRLRHGGGDLRGRGHHPLPDRPGDDGADGPPRLVAAGAAGPTAAEGRAMTDTVAAREPSPLSRGRTVLGVTRGCVTLNTVAILAQPVFAGHYLTGDYDMLAVHGL